MKVGVTLEIMGVWGPVSGSGVVWHTHIIILPHAYLFTHLDLLGAKRKKHTDLLGAGLA